MRRAAERAVRLIGSVVLALVAAGGTAAPVAAQDGGFQLQGDTVFVVDQVVAVVGNRPILASQIDEQLFTLVAEQQVPAPTTAQDTAQLREQILGDLVDEEILIQEAQRDTAIVVTEEEVAQGVDQQVRNVRGRFTSEVDYRNELRRAGFETPDEYRRYVGDQQRREFLRTRLMERQKGGGNLKPVQPTEREMQEFFEAQKAQLGRRPATITFRQIVIAPRASADAKQRARALADSIARGLRAGGDFATAARRFSQDPGSAQQGGDLGWQRRGKFERAFDNVVFNIKPGVISDPVETPFGFHVIQVERVQPTEVQARHILITPETTPADLDSARTRAEQVSAAARAGASFDSLQRIHHDGSEEREAANVPVDKLPPQYATSLASADSGAVVGPIELPGPDGRMKYAVIAVQQRRPEGDVVFADVKERIRSLLASRLAERQYIDRLRASTYVDIRTD